MSDSTRSVLLDRELRRRWRLILRLIVWRLLLLSLMLSLLIRKLHLLRVGTGSRIAQILTAGMAMLLLSLLIWIVGV
jgi:hypothetical protein